MACLALGEKGHYILLSTDELKALDYAMMAVKTLEDIPEAITDLLEKE